MTTRRTIKDSRITTMRTYGGSFVKALAEAYSKADLDNTVRIEKTFPEYMKKYGPDGDFPA
jgi:hypothetical protein